MFLKNVDILKMAAANIWYFAENFIYKNINKSENHLGGWPEVNANVSCRHSRFRGRGTRTVAPHPRDEQRPSPTAVPEKQLGRVTKRRVLIDAQ